MSAANVVRSHPNGAMLTAWVSPASRRNELDGYYGDSLRIRVKAPAERGQANRAVIDLLESALQCRVRLVGGAGSRRKRLVASGLTTAELISRLDRLTN
ncbi:MAG: DUF167 family protein, partial [Acidimicrobiia bacterium]|nr:DUF167 family protein [Acidimicrobiia bacterium]